MNNRNIRSILTNELDLIRNQYVINLNDKDVMRGRITILESDKRRQEEVIQKLEREKALLEADKQRLEEEKDKLETDIKDLKSEEKDADIYTAYSELSTNFRSIIYERDDYMLKYNDEIKKNHKYYNSMVKYKRMSNHYNFLMKNNDTLQKNFLKEFERILKESDYKLNKKELILADILEITKKILKK